MSTARLGSDSPFRARPGAVGFNFLELLPADETAALLGQRREIVAAHFDEIAMVPVEMREKHPGIEYLFRFYQSEIEWLDEIIVQLSDS